MADTPDNATQKANTNTNEQIGIQNIYVKDISFESPNSPRIFTEKWTPKLELEMTNHITQVGEEAYEVVLNVTMTVKTADEKEDKTAFLVEVHLAGIFTLIGFTENRMAYVLNGVCPNILFPYVREVIANLVARGGFQPLHLAPVNFEALFWQRMNQNQNKPEQQN